MIKIKGKRKCSVKIIRIGRRLQSVRSMRQGSVRSAVSVLTSTTAVSALIQNSTASSEPNVSSGKCPGTEEKEKWRWGNKEIGGRGDEEMRRWGTRDIG
jgi:hypothetical protein